MPGTSWQWRPWRNLIEKTISFALILTMVVSVWASLRPAPAAAVGNIHDKPVSRPTLDLRGGAVPPSALQQDLVSRMGGTVHWNEFGTPRSLIRYSGDGFLARGIRGRNAPGAALSWIRANRSLFRLTSVTSRNLELAHDSRLRAGKSVVGHVVLYRQTFGGLRATHDGLITVALKGSAASGWKVAYVSSSATGDAGLAARPRITGKQAWVKAAASVGKRVSSSSITQSVAARDSTGFTQLTVRGFAQPQRTRLAALPTPRQGVRPAYETIGLNSQQGKAEAWTIFVDAATGKVLLRLNRVNQVADYAPQGAPTTTPFSGAYDPTQAFPASCGADHNFVVGAGNTFLTVFAKATIDLNDIVILLSFNGRLVAVADSGFSPETLFYVPSGGVPAGTYTVNICPFPGSSHTAPFTYTGTFTANDTPLNAYKYPPRWKYFRNTPPLDYATRDSRVVACWEAVFQTTPVPGCQVSLKEEGAATSSKGPWDITFFDGAQPTFTTVGNNAVTAESWFNPLAPGATGFRPFSSARNYSFAWNNTWFRQKCNPAVFGTVDPVAQTTTAGPNANDRSSAAANLFSMHNRMHDWAYHLGFDEENYNLQNNNFGNTPPGAFPLGREKDPELGDVQAGAIVGGFPSFLGRDNANQITLNDGIAPITNMYLWQPITGAFYAPCVDGDFDMTVIGHEYTHAISNRMVAGADSGIESFQGGAMGESWSDLVAMEYLHEWGYMPETGPGSWVEGAYATGNRTVGIRDYALNNNPLNFSDIGFDTTGPEVHADGEIWNAVNYDLRKLLFDKYNSRFPSDPRNKRQFRCARGEIPPQLCPGNRRWVQTVFDAFLMLPPDLTFLDARDAYLAANRIRHSGVDQRDIWRAFARRGMGLNARTTSGEDDRPTPNFQSPLEAGSVITFNVRAANTGRTLTSARIFVGDYEARATPLADTNPTTPAKNVARMVSGTYRFLVQAPGYGAFRFTRAIPAGRRLTLSIAMPTNFASRYQGATASGQGTDIIRLIDDTENTNWARLDQGPVGHSFVTVNLSGGRHTFNRLALSALNRPSRSDADPPQSRFSELRSFDILVCTASAANHNCQSGFRRVYISPANAFPGVRPRPVAPNAILRDFNLTRPVTATHVRLRVLTNQCTGGPGYQGEQDNDPSFATDCSANSVNAFRVRAAELQVFNSRGSIVQK